MTTQIDRLRTDAIIAIHRGVDFNFDPFLKSIENADLVKEDMATLLAMGMQKPEFRMNDLSSAMPVSMMKIPEYADFTAGHTKMTNDPVRDWMSAAVDNRYGEHHPFGVKSNSCPLLHGSVHGDPAYADHIAYAMPNLQTIAEKERVLDYDKMFYGDPKETMYDLHKRDRNRYSHVSDEDYEQGKINEWKTELGFAPFLFGLEYNTHEQRKAFFDLLEAMNGTEPGSPDFRYFQNKMQEKAGLSWGRALRNWRERFTPLLGWWLRPSDRHGPVSPLGLGQGMMAKANNADEHIMSPWVHENGSIQESTNHHWWELFMPWGGVGRNVESLRQMFEQSYPKWFGSGWLSDMLINQNASAFMQYDHDGGSHFPVAVNHPATDYHPSRSAIKSSLGDSEFFEQRRANWSHGSNLHFLHPSEIKGQGGRMIVPSDNLMLSRLGLSLAGQADMGSPRIGMFREDHPSSSKEYWDAHNALYAANDMHLGQAMSNMAMRVMKQFGSGAINPTDPQNAEQSLIARGNLQQIASAADFALKKMAMGETYRALAPGYDEMGNMNMTVKPLGPVHPMSHATSPPVYNTGNTHLWGHEMPTNLTWKYDPKQEGIVFGMTDEPFQIMQRTAHEKHVDAVLPGLIDLPVGAKQKDIQALSSLDSRGLSPLATGDIHKSEDYKATGVFKTKIIPAYTIHNLDEMEKLRGFTGDWVVQKMPKGERMFIEKKGNHIKGGKLPSDVRKNLREITGDFTFDAYLDDGVLHVVDLLVHKGTDMHMEPLEDRVNALRTLYDSTPQVHFPMPTNCVSTDQEGLLKTVNALDKEELLIRDSKSTFMKEKEVHPKWIRYAKEDIAKAFYPPMPEVMVYPDRVKLAYPSIIEPVVFKGSYDQGTFNIDSIEGNDALFAKAERDSPIWGPVAISLFKTAVASSGGAFTSSSAGTHNPLHSSRKRKPKKLKIAKTALLRAPAIEGVGEEGDNVASTMKQVRSAITSDNKAKTTKKLLSMVEGLNKKMLEMFAGEYGIERTEDGDKWTVNEAIDDDIIERMFPRMNRISPDGGAWSGMQADITAPTGPTKLIDESATTFYDPKEQEEPIETDPIYHLKVKDGEDQSTTLDVADGEATLRVPRKTQKEMENEQEVEPSDRSEADDSY